MGKFREADPKRTCEKEYRAYRSFKKYLREDFNRRCGYCNDLDKFCGGIRGFHIDHFCPQDKFDHLSTQYKNLVYSCPYCNVAKSNDWPSGDENKCIVDSVGYVDPCDPQYELTFERYENGRIKPKNEVGKYMYKQLKLGLRRHQLAYLYEVLEKSLRLLNDELLIQRRKRKIPHHIIDHYIELTTEFLNYKKMFEETL